MDLGWPSQGMPGSGVVRLGMEWHAVARHGMGGCGGSGLRTHNPSGEADV